MPDLVVAYLGISSFKTGLPVSYQYADFFDVYGNTYKK